MTWTYTLALLSTSDLMQVRYLIGDTDSTEELLQDEEIEWVLTQIPNIYLAAAECCLQIAMWFIRRAVQEKVEQVQFDYRERANTYLKLKDQWEQKAKTLVPGQAYAGGISISDKETTEADTDRVQPEFYKGEFDNPDGVK